MLFSNNESITCAAFLKVPQPAAERLSSCSLGWELATRSAPTLEGLHRNTTLGAGGGDG